MQRWKYEVYTVLEKPGVIDGVKTAVMREAALLSL